MTETTTAPSTMANLERAATAGRVFSVDVEKRTIRGLAVPYGVEGVKGSHRFQFGPGAVTFDEVSHVKLYVNHDHTQAVGVATELEETDEGLVGAFRVARGPAGDHALTMAEDGVWDGMSIGARAGRVKYRAVDGVHHAQEFPLAEVSLTPSPTFTGARVRGVAFSDEEQQHMTQTATETPATETPETPAAATFSDEQTTAIGEAIATGLATGFASLTNPQEGRQVVSAGRPLAQVEEPTPYRFDGIAGGRSFSDDMRAAAFGNAEATQHLEEFLAEVFAVTVSNVGTLNPVQNRPDLFVPNLTFTRPLWESVSSGTVEDRTPFTVPRFGSASGLVGAHTEGTEPTPGAFTATSQTVTPTAMSGKIEINREVLDQGGNPQADAIIWGEMQNAYFEAIEARIASTLNAVTTTETNFASAVDAALVNAMQAKLIGLQFIRGGNRFTRLVLDGSLYPALAAAADSTGRKLLPIFGPTNAQGETSGGFDAISIGNLTGRAAWALGAGNAARSYLFVPSSVWAWASAPKRFTFEYQVKSVDLAIWGYAASAVLRESDVHPLDYTTADA